MEGGGGVKKLIYVHFEDLIIGGYKATRVSTCPGSVKVSYQGEEEALYRAFR